MDRRTLPNRGASSLPVSPQRAFTLIELLIVIGILSVLSGLAVPTYLESLTRARISKAKSDMRMFALGVESYFVDNAQYPIPDDFNGVPIPANVYDVDPLDTRIPISLTTPISYLGSLLDDPFKKDGPFERRIYYLRTRDYYEGANGLGTFDDHVLDMVGPSGMLQIHYLVLSRGPDQDREEPVGYAWAGISEPESVPGVGLALYDPTNGTDSSGDIVYLGAGIGFKQQ
jgi:prepilin-type N-terminal cleavage/methylation domain-containing protein